MRQSDKTALERFNEKYYEDKESGCWIWTGAKSPLGYGNFWKDQKYKKAHRAGWEFYFGDIEDGLFLCHICDNPSCVNPLHMFLGTQQDNIDDMHSKGRHINHNTEKKVCPKCGGEYSYCSKGKRFCRPCHNTRSLNHSFKPEVRKRMNETRRLLRAKKKEMGLPYA
jgi:hypothetical protein